jgi:hypothetical protein
MISIKMTDLSDPKLENISAPKGTYRRIMLIYQSPKICMLHILCKISNSSSNLVCRNVVYLHVVQRCEPKEVAGLGAGFRSNDMKDGE